MNFLTNPETNGNILLVISKEDLEMAFEDAISSFMKKMKVDTESRNVDEVLLSENEVLQKLGVTHSTLWRWNRKGYLPNVKIGRKVMWRQSDINRMFYR